MKRLHLPRDESLRLAEVAEPDLRRIDGVKHRERVDQLLAHAVAAPPQSNFFATTAGSVGTMPSTNDMM